MSHMLTNISFQLLYARLTVPAPACSLLSIISTALHRHHIHLSWWYQPWYPEWLLPEVIHPWIENLTQLFEFPWSLNSNAVLCFMSKQEKSPSPNIWTHENQACWCEKSDWFSAKNFRTETLRKSGPRLDLGCASSLSFPCQWSFVLLPSSKLLMPTIKHSHSWKEHQQWLHISSSHSLAKS